MPVEITITVKDHERTLKMKHLEYQPCSMNQHDPVIQALIALTIKEFNGVPDKVKITSKFEVV